MLDTLRATEYYTDTRAMRLAWGDPKGPVEGMIASTGNPVEAFCI